MSATGMRPLGIWYWSLAFYCVIRITKFDHSDIDKMRERYKEYTASLLLLAVAILATFACGLRDDRARQGPDGEVTAKAIELPSKSGPKSFDYAQFLGLDLNHWLIADFDQ